jgi:hypothetical protein
MRVGSSHCSRADLAAPNNEHVVTARARDDAPVLELRHQRRIRVVVRHDTCREKRLGPIPRRVPTPRRR